MANCKTYTYISDHCMVTMDTNLKKKKTKLDKISDSSKLTTKNLMANFTPPILQKEVILSQACDQLPAELQKMLGAVASKKNIKQIDRPKNPQFNKYISMEKEQAGLLMACIHYRGRFSQSKSRTTKTINNKKRPLQLTEQSHQL